MSASKLEKKISLEMKKVQSSASSDIIRKCATMATNYKITAEDLALCWEAHSINTGATQLNTNTWNSYRTFLEKKYAKSITPNQTSMKKASIVSRSAMTKRSVPMNNGDVVTPAKKQKGNTGDSQLEHLLSNPSTETPQKVESSQSTAANGVVTPPSAKVTYENRKNSGNVVVTYNPSNLDPIQSTSDRRICTITQPFKNHLQSGYKYMADKNRHSPLDQQFKKMTEDLVREYKVPLPNHEDEEEEEDDNAATKSDLPTYENVGVPRQAAQTNVGRICNSAHDGKLNTTTLLLEGSRHGSNGARIELDVKNLPHYSLYQGQIVAVTGVNSSGRKMVVEKMMEGHPFEAVENEQEFDIPKESAKEGVKVYAVAGPYTTNDNLDYQPLADLLTMVEVEKPDAVVMMGPFLDMKQELVKNGEDLVLEYEDGSKRHVSYEQFFAAKIANELEGLYESIPNLKTQFILVPSVDDAISEPVFPQPPLENALEKRISGFEETEDLPFGSLCLKNIEFAGDKKMPKKITDRRIHLVPNPSTICINDVTVGFTSIDSLLHISTETVNAKLPTSRMTRLAEHFIRQKSYYPIYPPSQGNGKDFNLDITQMKSYEMPIQPDVLILPSKLTSLAMEVSNGTTVVNPGHLTKGSNGGTYASLDIHPKKAEKDEKATGIRDRIRVEVRRI